MSVLTRRHAVGWCRAALALALLAGCGSAAQTSVTQLWAAPITVGPMKRVIVFAARMDEANRRALEDSYDAALAQHDVTARPSYTFFPGEPPSREEATAAVKEAGFDGILVSTFRRVRDRQTYMPGAYEGGFWNAYYGSGWGYRSPGYMITDEVVSFDTTVWDARAGDQLTFALTTETTNPSYGNAFVESLTQTVISALGTRRLVPPRRR